MICMSLLIFLISAALREVISFPSKITCPEVGSNNLRIARPVVDLPQPDSPTIPSVFHLSIVKLTSSTACRVPLAVLKYFFKFLTSRIVSAILFPPLDMEIFVFICKAGSLMCSCECYKIRSSLFTCLCCIVASRSKRASFRKIRRIRHQTMNRSKSCRSVFNIG